MDSQKLKEQIELLIDLQEKEQAMACIRAELERIPEQVAQMQAGLADIEKQIEKQEAEVDGLKKTYRDYEVQTQTYQTRIEKRNAQLRSVKTNQEYRAILKEIEDIQSGTSETEDKMLQCLDDLEAAEKSVAELSRAYKQEKAEIENKRLELEVYAQERRKAQDKLSADCEGILPHIEPAMLERYRFAQKQTGSGLAVVVAKECTCMGCHMNIPPQLFNELYRWDELRFCPHCHRILHVL